MKFSYQHDISNNLWKAIEKRYEAGDYSGAILDAIFLLSEILRERCDVDLDGTALVGKVFGGNDPLLKINNLRTETEKNEQKGIESILRGLFQAVRNPRAHEKIIDDKRTCDTYISFIDHLIKIIDKSKSHFEISDFCTRVFDEDFVETKEYAVLLVKEVPDGKKFDVLMEIINRREYAEPHKYSYIFNAFLATLDDNQVKEIYKIISEIIKFSDNDHDFRIFTKVFSNENWKKLELSARLRAENKLIKSFVDGCIYNNQCTSGSLGTWLINIIYNISLIDKFESELIKKLSSGSPQEVDYVFKYFDNQIIPSDKKPSHSLISTLNKGLKNGDKRFYDLIELELIFAPPEWMPYLQKSFDNFKEKNQVIEFDDIPF